ncbi:MAG: Uma2 family endonuclease [Caldilineaceae bacterium]
MSVQTRERPGQREPTFASLERNPPPLESGDRLSLPEFERRYHAHPEIKKAELIEGVVYVASPVSARLHGDPHFDVIGWLAVYRAQTPGVRGSDNATLRLDLQNEPQPDALLRLPENVGGKSYIAADGYLEGAPELIVEVAASSASYDLNQKKRVYARNQVPEYLVFETYEQQVHWFVLRQGSYEAQRLDEEGILKSQGLPGLWLHPTAFWAGEMATVLAVLQRGLASAEHAAFVETLTVKQK